MLLTLCATFNTTLQQMQSEALTEAGVREQYRAIEGQPAELVQVAVHGDLE